MCRSDFAHIAQPLIGTRSPFMHPGHGWVLATIRSLIPFAAQPAMHCKICDSESRPFGKGKTLILKKYEVQYYRCSHCGFIQTEEPYWLDEAYSNPIAPSDIGYVDRNRWLSACTRTVIGFHYRDARLFLDYGGGYGLFVRDLRDRGYDAYRLDKYTPNLFARDYEWLDHHAGAQADLVTSIEVFEHFPDPHGSLKDVLQYGSEILFSTSIAPEGLSDTDEKSWFYFASEEGQHVSLHTVKSLQLMAQRHGLTCYSNGRYLHLLTRKPSAAKAALFPYISRLKAGRLLQVLFNRPSLLRADEMRPR